MTQDPKDLRQVVQEKYGAAARVALRGGTAACCGPWRKPARPPARRFP